MAKNMPARMLSLLSLLQSRREWAGADLAARLQVTDRTVRRDIERLRELGYPVQATTGTAGGYRLASGRNLPPLLLDDEEAVAIAIGLQSAADGAVTGIEESAVRALTKLDQVLPDRLRRQVATFAGASIAIPGGGAPKVNAQSLTILAAACRDHERVRFDYRDRRGNSSTRDLEPYSLVAAHRRWLLIGYDLDRSDWRNFRLDRMGEVTPTGRLFPPRPLPAEDVADFVAQGIAAATYRYGAEVQVEASAEVVNARITTPIPGRVEAAGDDACLVRLNTDDLEVMTQQIAMLTALGYPLSITTSDDVRSAVRALARRLDTITAPPPAAHRS